jgi:hypothetical protein
MPARVLIIVMFETRALDLTGALLKKNLFDRLQADIALCVGENPREVPNELYDRAKYIWKHKDPTDGDWAPAFDSFAAQGHDWRCLLELGDQWFGGVRHPTLQQEGTGCLQLFFRELLRRRIEEAGIVDQYDWFVVTRSDFMWPTMHPPIELFSPDCVYLPDGERYRGYTDRHALVPRQHVRRFLEICKPIFDAPEDLARRMKARSLVNWNTESFVKFRLEELGLGPHVRFMPYMMYTVKTFGGPTGPGAPGGDNLEQRLYVKYPQEYTTARAVQLVVASDEDWPHMIGLRRFFNWRFYLFAWLRVLAERHLFARRLRPLRLLRRFLVYVWQPH